MVVFVWYPHETASFRYGMTVCSRAKSSRNCFGVHRDATALSSRRDGACREKRTSPLRLAIELREDVLEAIRTALTAREDTSSYDRYPLPNGLDQAQFTEDPGISKP